MPDEFCVPDGNDFSDTGPDIVDSDSFDVTSDSSVDDLSVSQSGSLLPLRSPNGFHPF